MGFQYNGKNKFKYQKEELRIPQVIVSISVRS